MCAWSVVQGSAQRRTQEHTTKLLPQASTTRPEASCPRRSQPLTVAAAGPRPHQLLPRDYWFSHDALDRIVLSAYAAPCVHTASCQLQLPAKAAYEPACILRQGSRLITLAALRPIRHCLNNVEIGVLFRPPLVLFQDWFFTALGLGY